MHPVVISQPKRQRVNTVREATTTQNDETSGQPTDSLKSVETFATYYPSKDLPSTHQRQGLIGQRTEHNAPDYPNEALQYYTATVTTNSEAINSTTIYPHYYQL